MIAVNGSVSGMQRAISEGVLNGAPQGDYVPSSILLTGGAGALDPMINSVSLSDLCASVFREVSSAASALHGSGDALNIIGAACRFYRLTRRYCARPAVSPVQGTLHLGNRL